MIENCQWTYHGTKVCPWLWIQRVHKRTTFLSKQPENKRTQNTACQQNRWKSKLIQEQKVRYLPAIMKLGKNNPNQHLKGEPAKQTWIPYHVTNLYNWGLVNCHDVINEVSSLLLLGIRVCVNYHLPIE